MHKHPLPEIIFENDSFIVVNKPSGLLSVPAREGNEPSLKMILEARFGKIFTVHRLDKDTSGIIIFAKDATTHQQLSLLFENREVQKFYYGLVLGSPTNKIETINAPIAEHYAKAGQMMVHQKGKECLTSYSVEKDYTIYSWLKFQLHTGRTHQIRVHCKHISHPIVCDDLYGDGKPVLVSSLKRKFNLSKSQEEEKPILGRLGLHAFELHFSLNNTDYKLTAPLSKDIRATLSQLDKHKS